ncbi:MAG: primosomal protein N' [Bacteroidales bacterium]|nr:primosomal protein N' [Bacteroidales bacterium]
MTLFADVLLPLPVSGLFTYRVPYDMNDSIIVGQRVVVQFGKKKIYTAIVTKIHQNPPANNYVKYISSILDIQPLVNHIQLKFWDWISEYYMCTKGEVMNVALPSALKLASESKIVLNPDFNDNFDLLNEKEYLIAEALSIQKTLTITEVAEIVDQKKIIHLIKTLIEKGVVLVEEELKERYKPKIETYVRLTEKYNDEDNLKEAFKILEKKAYKQLELLMSYITLSNNFSNKLLEVKRPQLLKSINASSAQLNSLIKKGILETYEKISSRLEQYNASLKVENIQLNEFQSKAYQEIKKAFQEKDVVLFHGVTSSGKTEIYIKLIKETIDQGKQVLYLLPEIALTTQIINRLKKYFGENINVYHSKYNENERVEIWNKVLKRSINNELQKSDFQIILGPRSSLFLPFNNLGLIIVDEEHDSSYKQYDPAPRYNARDSAIYLASMHKAKTILGSATPSIESYFNAKSGKYALVELNKRYGGIQMPEILVVDLKKESRQKTMKSHFSSFLLKHIEEALKNNEQVILFQNRRGFSLRLECDICNYMPECKNCDVTLIYHKHINQLRCHYCGYSTRIPERCPACGSTNIIMKGFGTEKVEEELAILLPEARISRMDLDTTRSKNAYQKIINDFEEKRIDILVGTQMVTKGLDFDNVSIVGVLNADNMINFPDFRSFERSFQLMAQVSGRAGRKNKRGKVIIQAFNPYHSVIRYVIDNDYSSMFQTQIAERKNFKYPPFYRLIQLKLKHKDYKLLNNAAGDLAKQLRGKFGNRILGPEYPIVSRIKNQYLKHILIKLERNISLSSMKLELKKQIDIFYTEQNYKSVRVLIDVDPL